MSLVDRIEAKIREKGLNFKRVERDCSLGNGTIKRWGEQSPRLDKLILVSEYLHVSLDYLVFGSESEKSPYGDHSGLDAFKKEQGITCDGSPLTFVETDLIAMFRLLDERDRGDVFDFAAMKYEKATGEKVETYSTYQTTTEQAEPESEPPRRIPFAASGWADITPEQDDFIQQKLREFERRSEELKGK